MNELRLLWFSNAHYKEMENIVVEISKITIHPNYDNRIIEQKFAPLVEKIFTTKYKGG